MLERTLTKEENSVQIFFFSPGDGPSNRLRLKCPVSATLDRGIDFQKIFTVLWIRIRLDPELRCYGPGSSKKGKSR